MYRPGSCLYKNFLYIFGGEIMIPNYNKTFNVNAYSLNLDSLVISSLQFKTNECLSSKSIAISDSILVLGGQSNSSFMSVIEKNENKAFPLSFTIKDEDLLQNIEGNVMIVGSKKIRSFKAKNRVWKTERIFIEKVVIKPGISNITNNKPISEIPHKKPVVSEYYQN